RMFRDAISFVTNLAAEKYGRTVLFVGTKRQAQDAVREEALRAGQFYINHRWLGGLLTNFQTVQKSIKRFKDLESMQTDGRSEKLTKKERLQLDRERVKLEKTFSGIKSMTRLPDAIFVIDVRKEEIAVAEANHLGIPVIAVVDTNCSPEGVDHVIPGNDDALRAVRLFASRVADAILEGQQMLQVEEEVGNTEDAATPDDTDSTDSNAAGAAGSGSRRRHAKTAATEATEAVVASESGVETPVTTTTETIATTEESIAQNKSSEEPEFQETVVTHLSNESDDESDEGPEELILEAVGSASVTS
ncbi:MAG: 30S ribosomal protein S2, partial [Pyrinomonadaceae bacterium]